MKFIACSDLHIHSKVPENRKGLYFEQVVDKFAFILETSRKTDSKILVIAGDFFDSAKIKYEVTNKILKLLQKYKEVKILAVPGQHDLHYHVSGLDNAPLGILGACKLVTILGSTEKIEINGTSFIGAGWNEEPETEANVLLIHRMITKKGELWPGQTNYSTAHAIMRKYPWANCIISGDNHLPHALRIKEEKTHRLQVNCGSMVRSTKTQITFKPRCWIIDTESWKSKAIFITCEPPEDVFDLAKITINELKKEMKEEAANKISKFIDALIRDSKEKPNFSKVLSTVVQEANPKQSVKDIINLIMERVS